MKKVPPITIDELKSKLMFDPETGIFTHRDGEHRRAGHLNTKTGYRSVMVCGLKVYAQQLAWFWTHGTWPRLLRFQNGNHDDCRISNLAEGRYLSTKYDHSTKEGKAAYQLEYREVRREDFRQQERERKFGLDLAQYSAMVAAQDNKCAICACAETATRKGRVKALAVDHDHVTGKIRGLLCVACNTGIGKFKDDRNLLLSAVKYIDKHSGVERVAAKLEVVRNEQ